MTGWPTEFLKKFQNNSKTFQEHNFHIFQEHMDGQYFIIFSHKWEIQTGGNWKSCKLRSRSSNSEFKNNFRTSLKKWLFSSTFPVPKKFQNNSRNSRNSRTVGHPVCPYSTCHEKRRMDVNFGTPQPSLLNVHRGSKNFTIKFHTSIILWLAHFSGLPISAILINKEHVLLFRNLFTIVFGERPGGA